MTPDVPDASAVLVEGPWTHRVVSANGRIPSTTNPTASPAAPLYRQSRAISRSD